MMCLAVFLFIALQGPFVVEADFQSYDVLASISDIRKLKVGQELFQEELALWRGRCVYELQGLELSKSYEVKVSYPASIPASFTIELLKEGSFQATRGGRKLLNTEKLMFRADESKHAMVYDGMLSVHVLITVESAGVVAKRYTKERATVIYNILCEEVRFGIPRQAWWIGILGAIAIMGSVLAPMLLPPHLLPRRGKETSRKLAT